jgi:hypothetical protein
MLVVGFPGLLPAQERVPAKPGEFEARFRDGSTLRFKILDDSIPFITRYGSLTIPTREIQSLTIGIRLTEAEQKALDAAVADLLGNDGARREAAKATLLKLGVRVLPVFRKIANKMTGDASAHAQQVLAELKKLPEADTLIEGDSLATDDDSLIAGRVGVATLKIDTFQFGELKLKLVDVRELSQGKLVRAAAAEKLETYEAQGSVMILPNYQQLMGKTFYLRTIGRDNGSVWGTGLYTLDSDVGTIAVHMGKLKVGETGLIKVQMVPDPGSYTGSTQNGITTNPFSRFPYGALKVLPK